MLLDNLGTLDRVIEFVCRRNRIEAAEIEDFASMVKVKLLDDDCAILRKFEGRSKLSTFLTVVVHRMLLDYRVHAWGKWHPSAEAQKSGMMAVEIEKLLRRDGRSIDEALTILAPRFPDIRRETIMEMDDRLPRRSPRPRAVPIEEAAAVSIVDEPGFEGDRKRLSNRVSSAMSEAMSALSADDRLILQLRFESGMTVAAIARSLQIEQKLLYRRIDQLLARLRESLESQGMQQADVADLIGRESADVEFPIGKTPVRPSTKNEGGIA